MLGGAAKTWRRVRRPASSSSAAEGWFDGRGAQLPPSGSLRATPLVRTTVRRLCFCMWHLFWKPSVLMVCQFCCGPICVRMPSDDQICKSSFCILANITIALHMLHSCEAQEGIVAKTMTYTNTRSPAGIPFRVGAANVNNVSPNPIDFGPLYPPSLLAR